MSSDPGPFWQSLIVIAIIIIINGYLTAAFTAMKSINKNNIRSLAQDGNSKAQAMLETAEEPYNYLLMVETACVFLGFMASSITAYYMSHFLNSYIDNFGIPFVQIVSIILCTLILTFVMLVLGILFPRRLALLYADKIAMSAYNKVKYICIIFKPLAVIVDGLTVLLLKLFRQRTDVTEAVYSEDEVVSMLESGQESGELNKEGMKMITSIFAFDDMLAFEIMTPRTDVFSININDPAEEYIDELMEWHYSRIPVYEDDSDNIIGILYIKDYLIKAREVGFDNLDLRSILRKPHLVPETKKIDTLFMELQTTKQHIAILIDEYGGFSGIVTMEDIIEEVMGDIDDEYDEVEPEIQVISDTEFIIDGSMGIDDINEELGVNLESDNSETIGGLLIDVLGEIPDAKDIGITVNIDNLEFRIDSIRDRRIEQITLTILAENDDEQGDNSQANN
ncbi:MAG: hemolysin family protein [Bacillota bacterium]|nr:hemolysin family protein [Bacillota bacterium]